MTKSLKSTVQISAETVLEAHELKTGYTRGIFCKVLTDTFEVKWVILSGARLSNTASGSLSNSYNYARAYANYQDALKLTQSGVLQEHYILPKKGSESQCLTIIQGTPSSMAHAKRHLRTLSGKELSDLLGKKRELYTH